VLAPLILAFYEPVLAVLEQMSISLNATTQPLEKRPAYFMMTRSPTLERGALCNLSRDLA
jgi:hypothetical protein